MAETEERIRQLEKRLAQAEARIAQLETYHPRPIYQPFSPWGPITCGPAAPFPRYTTAGDPNTGRGYAVSLTSDGYELGPISGTEEPTP